MRNQAKPGREATWVARGTHRGKALRAAVMLAVLAIGCSGPNSDVVCSTAMALRGGLDAPETQWDAIGALGTLSSTMNLQAFCTGVLVNADTILTAKHCLLHRLGGLDAGTPIYFGIGPDSAHLRKTEVVIDIQMATPDTGGYTGLGSDMALAKLAHQLTEVTPLQISDALLDHDAIGHEFVVVGYGAITADGISDGPATRRRGLQTLRAVSGNVFDLIYGSRSAFLARGARDQKLAHSACAATAQFTEELEQQYARGALIDQYEVWAGGDTDGTQACHGDSGGPLLQLNDASLPQVVGVTSWSWESEDSACDYGSAYSVLGPEDRTLVARLVQ